MAYWCYTCLGPRADCPEGSVEGECGVNERIAADYAAEKEAGKYRTPYLMSVPGGTTDLAKKMDHTRKFHKDMAAYESARRAGERPDGTTVEGVERARRRHEFLERASERGAVIADG